MSPIDAGLLRRSLPQRTASCVDKFEIFDSIASTNTHLLGGQPPAAGRIHLAMADHQYSGRGRSTKRWVAPPGSGICLSFAYTFKERRADLSSLTLALGVGVVEALADFGVNGIGLKWPNDIVAADGKLGGILTETQVRGGDGVTVVTGIGLNVRLPDSAALGVDAGWSLPPVDLAKLAGTHEPREAIAGGIAGRFHATMIAFAEDGFGPFSGRWQALDWLRGKSIVVTGGHAPLRGEAAGIDSDGALLLVAAGGRTERVTAGSVALDDPARDRR